jgi:hypothetical protein
MDLVAKISLDSQDYEKNVESSKKSFSALGSSIASGAKTIAKVGVGAFTAIGTAIGGATTALIKNAGETASYADNIDKLSQKMGFTTDAFQEWDFIMQHNGSSIDSVKGAMIKLDKALDSNSEAFKELGLNAEAMQNMTNEEKWEASVKALQGVTDETKKAELAQELFGKSYQEFMPLLNSTAEATEEMKQQVHDLGGVMSEDAVKAGAQYQDSLQNLKTALTGAKNNLMGEFLPSLSTVMDGLTKLFSGDESGIGMIKKGIEDFAQKLNEKLPKVIQTAGSILTSLISALPQAFEAIASQLPSILEQAIPVLIDAVVGLADAVVSALPKIIEAIEKNIDKITSGLQKILLAVGQIILKLTPKLLPMMIKVALELVKALAKGFIENASEVIGAIFELVDVIVKELTNPETLSQLLECGIQIIIALAQGLLENLPMLLGTVLTVISNVVTFLITDGIPLILQGAWDMFKAIGDGLMKAWDYITSKLGEMIGNIIGDDGIGGWLSDVIDGAKAVFEGIGDAIGQAWETIKDGIVQFGKDIWNGIKEGLGDMLEKGKELINSLFEGLKKGWDKVKNFFGSTGIGLDTDEIKKKMKEAGVSGAEAYVDGQQEGFDINSPSKKMKWIGEMVMSGYAEGMEDETPDAVNKIQDAMNDVDYGAVEIDSLTYSPSGAKAGKSMDRLIDFARANSQKPEIIQLVVGGRVLEEIFIDAKRNITTRSGGQVSV